MFSMLNSCAPNVAVVNVDNGFGAAIVAALIARGER
jgi:NCAIR mutase (PurE)-related protein